MVVLATTQTSNLATNGANLSTVLYFALLAGLVVAVIVHLLGGLLAQEKLTRLVQAFISGVVVMMAISLVTTAIAGTNGQNPLAQAMVAAAGLTVGTTAGLSQTTLVEGVR